MAGLAAVAGIGFFFISSRSMKKQAVGQQGIDPSNLVGYQTSASSGGYQTNRGEAQLKSDADYNQTRSVYDASLQEQTPPPQEQTPPPQQQTPPPTASAAEEAACGCAASAEMGSECDCEMQGSCLCDGTCACNASICQEHTSTMR